MGDRTSFPVRNHGPLCLAPSSRTVVVPRKGQTRRSYVLTRRDREILRALHLNTALTAEQVEWAFFPPAGPTRRYPSSSAYARLRHLFEDGYLNKLRVHPPETGGSHQRVLVLDRKGRELVASELGEPEDAVPAQRRPGRVFLAHALAISQLWAALVAAIRGSEYGLPALAG